MRNLFLLFFKLIADLLICDLFYRARREVMTTMPPVPMVMIIMSSPLLMFKCRAVAGLRFFCLPNDRREFGERVSGDREFGEWNNNHSVFLSVKVLVLCW